MVNRKSIRRKNTKKKRTRVQRGQGLEGTREEGSDCFYSSGFSVCGRKDGKKLVCTKNDGTGVECQEWNTVFGKKTTCKDSDMTETKGKCRLETEFNSKMMKAKMDAQRSARNTAAAAGSAASSAASVVGSAGSVVVKKFDDAGRLTQAGRMSTKEEVITLGSFFLSVFKRVSEEKNDGVIKYGNNFIKKIITSIMPETAPADFEKWYNQLLSETNDPDSSTIIEGEEAPASLLLLSKIFASTERRDKKSYQTIINALFDGETVNDSEMFGNILKGNKETIRSINLSDREPFNSIVNKYTTYTPLNGLRIALLMHMSNPKIEKSLTTELLGFKRAGKRKKKSKRNKKRNKKSFRRNRK